MSDRLLVMCASRGRPEQLARMIRSVRDTSRDVDVVVYLDEDDEHRYDSVQADVLVGPRVGQVASLNALCEKFRSGHVACGAATDDCEFRTPGWDEWVRGAVAGFRGGVGAISPHCDVERRMDFPWLSGVWIDVAGSFVPVPCEHFYWDVALEWVGELTQISFATKDDFHLWHQGIMPEPENNPGHVSDYQLRVLRSHTDARGALNWLALNRRDLVRRLREAMGDEIVS